MDTIGTIRPHSDFGDPSCCGCLKAIIRGSRAEITCNECHKIVRIVSASDIHRTLDQMQLALDIATAKCSRCGAVNLFPGFSKMLAFTCKECGQAVMLAHEG